MPGGGVQTTPPTAVERVTDAVIGLVTAPLATVFFQVRLAPGSISVQPSGASSPNSPPRG